MLAKTGSKVALNGTIVESIINMGNYLMTISSHAVDSWTEKKQSWNKLNQCSLAEEECWECLSPAEASRRQTIKWNNFKVTVTQIKNWKNEYGNMAPDNPWFFFFNSISWNPTGQVWLNGNKSTLTPPVHFLLLQHKTSFMLFIIHSTTR